MNALNILAAIVIWQGNFYGGEMHRVVWDGLPETRASIDGLGALHAEHEYIDAMGQKNWAPDDDEDEAASFRQVLYKMVKEKYGHPNN